MFNFTKMINPQVGTIAILGQRVAYANATITMKIAYKLTYDGSI